MINNLQDKITNISKLNLGVNKQEMVFSSGVKHSYQLNSFTSVLENKNILGGSIDKNNPSSIDEENIYREKSENGHTNYYQSDILSQSESAKNSKNEVYHINYESLPKYGLCEKAIQTMLTARDIDDLEYVMKEFNKDKDSFTSNFVKMTNSFLFNASEKLKSKVESSKTDHTFQKNFIQIKRKSDVDLQPVKQKSKLGSKHNSNYNFPHMHVKQKIKEKFEKRKNKLKKDLDVSNNVNKIKKRKQKDEAKEKVKSETNSSVIFTSEVTSIKQTNKEFQDEFNIAQIINEIKSEANLNNLKVRNIILTFRK